MIYEYLHRDGEYVQFLRIGNWNRYFEVLFEFFPFCFCFNRHNHTRNLSYYYVHIRALMGKNATAWKYLAECTFSGSLTGRPHSRISFDHVIEMTINKSCKDIGGLSGNTQYPGATQRQARVRYHIAALREQQNKEIKKKTMQKHVELSPGRIERDEADVKNIKTCIDTLLQNLCKHGHPISNFASGETATEEIINDIIDSRNRGEVARNEFIQ